MKKVLFLMILSAFLLLVACGEEKAPEKKAVTPVEGRGVAYSHPTEATEDPFDRNAPGYIPSPEPIVPTEISAEK